jgi:hypothetical protein
MLYKTMVLELLRRHPETYEPLRRDRKLLAALETYATELSCRHSHWEAVLAGARPGSSQTQIASEALELALQELDEHLASGTPPQEAEPLSLDAAMDFIRHHSQPA